MTEKQPPSVGRTIPWRLLGVIFVLLLAVIFVVQNTDSTTVEFLFVDARVHLWVVILVSMALGALLALGLSAHRRGRNPKVGRVEH